MAATTGRRSGRSRAASGITWDDVPDNLADPNVLSADFTNDYTAARGALVYAHGYLPRLEVSANASNPTSTPILFGQSALFTAYSPQRVMRASSVAGTAFAVDFQIPGTTNQASVSGFGVVFTDVNVQNGTRFTVFDEDFRNLGTFYAPHGPGHQTVSFLGVIFPAPTRISYIDVIAGSAAVDGPEDATHDLVATDDLIFGEPQPERSPQPSAITVTTPTAQAEFTVNGPFLTLAGTKTGAHQLTWTNDRGGSGFAFGQKTAWSIPDIPIAPGPNTITIRVGDSPQNPATAIVRVNGGPYTYSFAEGSTGGFFDTDIAIANPNAVAAPVTIMFLREDGGRIETQDTLAPMSRKTIHVDDTPGMEGTAFSTIVTSTNRLPLVVERSMFWDRSYYGGKGAVAVTTPSETWLFAEGVQNSFFSTFVLLENPGTDAATATLMFDRAFDEPPVSHEVTLPPLSRVTVDTSTIPELAGRSFGLSIQATRPIVAERATYFGSTPTQLWPGGHGSPGVTAPSGQWFFAEGASGPFRETFLLLSNPTDTDALANVEFSGGTFSGFGTSVPIPPHSRVTVPIESLSSGSPAVFPLADAEFTIRVTSGIPIVAERAMYWLGAPGPWADGTSVFGVNETALRWGFAEGRAGSTLDYHTYIRIYNPNHWPVTGSAEVRVTFIKSDGSTIVRNYSVPPFKIGEPAIAPYAFITIDANAIPELLGDSFATIIESTNDVPVATERSMYWDSNGVFWAGGIATAGTRLP